MNVWYKITRDSSSTLAWKGDKAMIGLSPVPCINDILRGKVKIGAVEKILSAVDCADAKATAAMMSLFDGGDDRTRAQEILNQLLAEGKIHQYNTQNGYAEVLDQANPWVNKANEIRWKTMR